MIIFYNIVFVGNIPKIPIRPNFPVSYFEDFSANDIEKYWIPTSEINYTAIWHIEDTYEPISFPNEKALVMKSKTGYGAVSTKLKSPISFQNKTFILQYEMRPEIGLSCTGTYIKLFSDPNFNEDTLTNKTPFTIMFGPDKCGTASNKIQFIWNYYHQKHKHYIEKQLKEPPHFPTDPYNHLYTLIIRSDNSYSILLDNIMAKNGSLFFDFNPPLEKRLIDDPNDKKPNNFKGNWKPRKIKNPYYIVDLKMNELSPITALGFEILVNNRDIAFMNILIAHDEKAVMQWNKDNFLVRQKLQKERYFTTKSKDRSFDL